MGPLPFSSYGPIIHWPRLESGATVRWPFLLAALLTFLVTSLCLIADANGATVAIGSQSCPIHSAYEARTGLVVVDACNTINLCASAAYSAQAVLTVGGCSVDRISAAGFEP